jgi:FAD binding domain
VSDPETLTSLRCQIRSTSTYRRGRVLLAGDAVHIHSPAGGQGMNTGMLDATNLAWKLALVVRGRTSDTLLDSYAEERRPVATEVLRFSESLVRFATSPRSPRRTLRDAVLPGFRLPPLQRRLARRLSQTSVAYPPGPLTRPGRVAGLPEPGQRMPDVPISSPDGPRRLYEELRRGRHLLLEPSGAGTWGDVGPAVDLVDVLTAAPGGVQGSVLVRPDGHVAAVGTPGDMAAISGYLRDLAAGPTSGQGARRPAGGAITTGEDRAAGSPPREVRPCFHGGSHPPVAAGGRDSGRAVPRVALTDRSAHPRLR